MSLEAVVEGHRVVALSEETWPLFEALAARHNGVWGGCWCTYFHRFPEPPEVAEIGAREYKRRRVLDDHAHAALVLDDAGTAIAWAEYGPPAELPNLHHRKQYEAQTQRPPDYRITCLFVDRAHRRQGLASVAVRGALDLIAQAGGGLVESYPHDVPPGKKTSASYLYNATRTMYERLGFEYLRPKGQGNCVMSLQVAAA